MKRKLPTYISIILVITLNIFFITPQKTLPQLNATTQQVEIEEYEARSYPVKASYTSPEGDVYEETYYITVMYPRTEIKGEEAIDAYDINVYNKDISKLTEAEIVQLANARAWNTRTNEPIAITEITIKKQDENIYKITFATANATTTTITLTKMPAVFPDVVLDTNAFYIDIPEIKTYRLFSMVSIFLFAIPLILLGLNYARLHQQKKKIWLLLHEAQQKIS